MQYNMYDEFLLDIKSYRNMLSSFEAGLDKILSEYAGFVPAQSDISEKRDEILKEYEESANLFSSIFKFRLENFHSEMLRKLLDKNTPDLGNPRYLNLFMQALRNINPAIKEHIFGDNVSVVCEAGEKQKDGRIDIFIYDDVYGVIIENKINGAPDQSNQLAKYMRFAKRIGKEIIAVVYIPPPNKNSVPPLEGYDEDYQEYIPEIVEKLVILPVVNTNTKKDIVHGFLGTCLELPGNNDTQKYILSQYAKLLTSIKGVREMTKDVDMALLAECYKDKKSISIMENLNEVWNNREYLLGGLLRDTMRERLTKELGFEVDQEDEPALYKQINDKSSLYFASNTEDYLFWFGLWFGSPIEDSLREQLREFLDIAAPEAYFEEAEGWENNWLVKQFHIDKYKESLTGIADYLIERYRLLEKKVLKAFEV